MLGATVLASATWLLALGQCALAADIDWTTIKNSRGDHLPDFSFCGYHSSDVALPSATRPSTTTIKASSKDQTSDIQAALNKVSAAGGGVVELGPGTFKISPGLSIPNGTTLKGSGVGSTHLSVSKLNEKVPLISLGNGTGHNVKPLSTNAITDSYVGIGASTVTVKDTKGLKVGQTIFVNRAATAKWIRYDGMADLTRKNNHQTWIKEGTLIQQPRIIGSIKGNKVTLTVPLTDALDKNYMSPYLAPYTAPSVASEIGLENLSITLKPSCSGVALTDSTNGCKSSAISVSPWTVDSYIRSVNVTGFNSFISAEYNSSRITIDHVGLYRDRDTDNKAGYPADIAIMGSHILVQDSGQYGIKTAKAFSVATQAGTPGPNAILRHVVQAPELQQIYPHQRWAHGILAEDTDAGVIYQNRNNAGSGHGWAINAGVAWNVRGGVTIQSPPLGVNFGIGVTGKVTNSNGTMTSPGKAVTPQSLFSAQLAKRKGGK
ncbi:uncharacterized protein GGS22DRAFT_194312 [Annulohypoxylon maeteangense]|uniref:uncharacterized protein n=1 Tax=Annulohypoxylon maeteangense TaxID=1927788 RepID=UPI0020080ED2|nr:uncharacterized protein GGS22DRAFT_194312 [Annulohypoxylon maeteangense]KAI0890105.1 hypothetical protein GGS22DRAFT_194312 [Annulohypoxylon maeteangense]